MSSDKVHNVGRDDAPIQQNQYVLQKKKKIWRWKLVNVNQEYN
jgi:hypothetical protein